MLPKALFIVLLSISSSFLGAQGAPAPDTTSSKAPAATPQVAAAQNGGKNKGGGNDAQTSLTLDPRVIAKGFAQDGQQPPVAGQVASLTSTNNFINFCLTVPNLPLTNGQQIKTGSCNPAPIGAIPSTAKMPSSKFKFPENFGTVPANTNFTIQMEIQNLQTGNFVNAQQNYFGAPQQLSGNGEIVGHSHVVIEKIDSLSQTTPTDPNIFAFFKGLNAQAAGGILTADVTNGLAEGTYRLASINTAANHQPAIVPIAQHGSLDDAIYFTVTASGKASGGAQPPAKNKPSSSTSSAGAASTPAKNGGGAKKNQGSNNFGRCPTPGVVFGQNFGVKGTAFRSNNRSAFPGNASKNIGTIVDSICMRLANKKQCGASPAAVAKCRSAAAAAKRSAMQSRGMDGRAADTFNAAFGRKTAFGKVKAKS